ncbi:MAG: ABC transporter permease, partial [Pyramidobacter sp.]|nr:ABC transporter permease [Pyramidobacter sp.]
SRGKILALALTEALLISFYGAVLGTSLGAAAVAVVSPAVSEALKLPFLLPSWRALILLGVASVTVSVLTGVLSALFSARRASRADIYDTLRGN